MCASACTRVETTVTHSGPPLTAAAAEPVSFIDDDFVAAAAQARAQGKLLFVDAWAPWCHTCLSMRELVLSRPELSRFSDRFVFAAVDTDKLENSAFVERYPLRTWPTLMVIEPHSGELFARYGGSLSLDELSALLEAAEQRARDARGLGAEALLAAHAAARSGPPLEAARAYERAAAALPTEARTEALMGGIAAFYAAQAHEECVSFGSTHLVSVRGSGASGDFAGLLFACAQKLPEGAERAGAIALVDKRLSELTSAPPAGSSVDDQVYALGVLADLRAAQGDTNAMKAIHSKRLALIEAAVARAPSVAAAQVHDYERMNSLLQLGRGDEAVTLLTRRTQEMPDNYEPFARLGYVLLEIGKPKEALVPLERAIALSYGPRRVRYLAQKAKALGLTGDARAELSTLEQERAALLALPDAQRGPGRIADVDSRIDAAKKKLPTGGGAHP